MIFSSFARAVAQLSDRRFWKVLLLGIVLAALLLAALTVVFTLGVTSMFPDMVDLPLIGPVEGLHGLLGWATVGAMVLLSIFLMQPVALAFAGLFLDDVVDAVEQVHYGWLPKGRRASFGESMVQTINLIGLMIVINVGLLLLAVPLGPLAVPAFYLANGFLLGREYFTLVAARRLPTEAVKQLRRRHFLRIWAAGTLMAVPLLNLLIPVLAAATFAHLFHKIMATKAG